MKRILSISLILTLVMGMVLSGAVFADEENVNITILGTSDIHGAINSYDYTGGDDYGDKGFHRISSLIKDVRSENPNTLVVDNGDTVQGTILTDDLYNLE
ncbi:MAG: metallophosphoesterase, partial [Bacillota bacterium]